MKYSRTDAQSSNTFFVWFPFCVSVWAILPSYLQQSQVLVSAFSPVTVANRPLLPQRPTTLSRLYEVPPTESANDVDEAVEKLEEWSLNGNAVEYGQDEDNWVELHQELPEVDKDPFAKEKRLTEIQGIFPRKTLMSDITGRLTFLQNHVIPLAVSAKEAAVSASLYMNPMTKKISQNVKITWEPQVAAMLKQMEQVGNPDRPLMVGLVGIPGSGKSTSAEVLQAILGGEDRAIVMPHDGYHFPLATLASWPNAADAIYRRGAPDTFDPQALQTALDRIVYGDELEVTIPGFDHAVGDPTPDQHTFQRSKHRIVMCEGLYLLHDKDGWEHIKSFFDWTIYIDADVDACIERLKERNKCIPVSLIS